MTDTVQLRQTAGAGGAAPSTPDNGACVNDVVKTAPPSAVDAGAVEATFESILFLTPADATRAASDAPSFFHDLNLDQIVAEICSGRQDYNLTPLLYTPLHDADAVAYRHEVMRDLEDDRLLAAVRKFALGMRRCREYLGHSEKRYYIQQKERWFLDAADVYCLSVRTLLAELEPLDCRSRGFRAFLRYLAVYTQSERFAGLASESSELEESLSRIRYGIFIRGGRVSVYPAMEQPDYGDEIQATFQRFQQGKATDYSHAFGDSIEMDHIEGQVLEGVARLHPEVFGTVAKFRAAHANFADTKIVAFDREIQFYIGYLDRMRALQEAGLAFCYPAVSASDKALFGNLAFDLALAEKLSRSGAIPVCNDFRLEGAERIIVVSGPNQGGKTTFARMFGQIHYLAALGYPVPGTDAKLLLPDGIFTHFEREEHMTDLRGKLEDDLLRIRKILTAASPASVIVINEIFASTTLQDAIDLSKKIAQSIMNLDALCVWVTFIDEVASLGEKTVSMVSTVVPDNPAERTFKIIRRPADGLAYAMSIAEKHRLTPKKIRERMHHEGTPTVS